MENNFRFSSSRTWNADSLRNQGLKDYFVESSQYLFRTGIYAENSSESAPPPRRISDSSLRVWVLSLMVIWTRDDLNSFRWWCWVCSGFGYLTDWYQMCLRNLTWAHIKNYFPMLSADCRWWEMAHFYAKKCDLIVAKGNP